MHSKQKSATQPIMPTVYHKRRNVQNGTRKMQTKKKERKKKKKKKKMSLKIPYTHISKYTLITLKNIKEYSSDTFIIFPYIATPVI